MSDWNDYRVKTRQRIVEYGLQAPDTLRGAGTLMTAGNRSGHLDERTRELIALACAVTTRCDGCIAIHAEAAVKAGVSDEEIAEALGVAVSMNAGAAMVYSGHVTEALKQAREQQ